MLACLTVTRPLAASTRPLRVSTVPRPAARSVGVRTTRGAAPRLPTRCASLTAGGAPTDRAADTRLGELFLRLLPGWAYYLPALLYPLTATLAGLGAAHAPALMQHLATTPAVQALGPLAPLLARLSSQQPWASLLCVLGSLLTVELAFLATPLMDFLLGRDLRNPSEAEALSAAQAALHRGILYAYTALHLGMLLVLAHVLSTTPVLPLAFLGATVSAGVAGGILFTTAHELVHGPSWLDRAAASALLVAVGYPHWAESHLAHHVKVATPEDPSSARRGETLYRFIPRSIWGNLVDGYSAEARRLRKRGLPLLVPQNRMLWWVGGPLALAGAAFLAYGWKGLAFAVGQAAVSIFMLETVNFVEHYGLQRRRGADGRYERVGPQHSWSASFMFTSAVAFRLQRHADHHMFGTKPYQMLRDLPEAPQLPFSYPVAMMLAAVPPLYFSIMDPLLDAYAASRKQAGAEQPEAAPAQG